MGKSKHRKNHKQKSNNRRKQQDAMQHGEMTRWKKKVEEYQAQQQQAQVDHYAKKAQEQLAIDPVTQTIMSNQNALIHGLAENMLNNNGNTASSALMDNPYQK